MSVRIGRAAGLAVVIALAVTAACGRSAPSPPATSGPEAGATTSATTAPPVTGARDARVAPTGLAAHEARVRAWLEAHAGPRVAPARLARAPLQRLALTVDDARLAYEGSLEIALVNDTGEDLAELAFAIPVNAAVNDPRAARVVTVAAVEVDGRPVTPGGGASLVRVPVALAAGQAAQVRVTFSGTLPELPAPAWGGAQVSSTGPVPSDVGRAVAGALAHTADLDRVAELAGVDPYGAATIGHRAGLLLLARGWPLLLPLGTPLATHATAADVPGFAPSHFTLEVTAPNELVLAASGAEFSRERADATRKRTRFVAPAVREVAVVAGRELTTTSERVGGVAVVRGHRAAGQAAGDAVGTTARRALEVYEDAFGPYPWGQLTVVEGPLSGASALAFPGLVVVNSSFYEAPAEFDPDDPLLAVLTRHPALREGLAFAVAHAVAHQWWGQLVGVDAAREPWLSEALAGVAALMYFDDAQTTRAVRRQRELLLALPFQLARLLGGRDHPVRVARDRLATTAAIAAIHHGKAALWLDATRRAMSDTLYREALRGVVRDHAHATIDRRTFVEALAARAPDRGEVARLATRWLDEAHGDEDIGGVRPDLLLEYLVGDAAVQGGARELMAMLADNEQLGELLEGLLGSGEVDAGRLVATVARLLGDGADPEVKRWLDLVSGVAEGRPSSWAPGAIDLLLDELGVGGPDRDAIRRATELVFETLDAPADADARSDDDAAP